VSRKENLKCAAHLYSFFIGKKSNDPINTLVPLDIKHLGCMPAGKECQ
jgi:hypothetical protein